MKKHIIEKIKQRYPRFFSKQVATTNVKMINVKHDHILQDEQVFDAIARHFFNHQKPTRDYAVALALQAEVLSRMPKGAHTEVRQFDLGEWSIYWNFNHLSLEFYVGQYGIFYAHVDQYGQEHRIEFYPEQSNHHFDHISGFSEM